MTIDFSGVNFLAVLVGGFLYMAFGALWFSPVLFGNTWVKLNQLSDSHMKNPLLYVGSAVVAFASSFVISLIIATTGADDLLSGVAIGLLIGLLAALVYFKNTLFGMMKRQAFAIAVGDHVIAFTMLSVLHALWK